MQSENTQDKVETTTTIENSYFGKKVLSSLVLFCYENELSLHSLNCVIEVASPMSIILQILLYSFLPINQFALLQGSNEYILKVNLVQQCCWTTIFKKDDKECVLVVLYQTGDIELR